MNAYVDVYAYIYIRLPFKIWIIYRFECTLIKSYSKNNENTTLDSSVKCTAHSINVNTNYKTFMRKSRKSIKFMDEIDM